MKDNIKVKLQGEITILRNGIPVFKEHNAITASAEEILLNCMGSLNTGNYINTIKVMGPFGSVNKGITDAVVDLAEGTITFVATALEGDFNDYINSLELKMVNSIDKVLATKGGLSILKNYAAAIEIRWKIKLNI